jgi:flagellar basal body-associated protein FliL
MFGESGKQMSRLIYILVGFLFVSGGVLTAVYIMVNKAEEKSVENNAYPFEERLKIAEELLSQSGSESFQRRKRKSQLCAR